MLDPSTIHLTYTDSLCFNAQWMLLYEYKITCDELFDQNFESILSNITNTIIFNTSFVRPDFRMNKVPTNIEAVWRPYIFDDITINDFNYLANAESFLTEIQSLLIYGGDFYTDTLNLINQTKNLILTRTDIKNGIWLIDRDMLKDENRSLAVTEWIFIYFKTFIEIDRKNCLIRTIDFGWD